MAAVWLPGYEMSVKPYTIRILDNDSDFTSSADHHLRSTGYEVKTYGDQSEFLSDTSDGLGCALVDLRLSDTVSVDLIAAARLSGYDAPIIITAKSADFSTVVKAGNKGAFDFLQKPVSQAMLIGAVKRACETHKVHRQEHGSAKEAIYRFRLLTEREQQVFWLLADGCITKAIAEHLSISIRTAEAHRSKVFEKFQTKRVADLVRASRQIAFLR